MPQQPIEIILLRQWATHMAIPIWIAGMDGHLVFYNEPAEQLLGVRFEDAGEMHVEQLSDLFSVLDEYGNAIKQLAAANIFPGDMLLKNFGVTRHGRVVFYDYDELVPLTDCNFRRVPPPRNEEDEMSGEVWYSVGPHDVFPETFGPFLLGNPMVREDFMKHHADLLDPAFWQAHKERIAAGHVYDVFPYERARRFRAQAHKELLD